MKVAEILEIADVKPGMLLAEPVLDDGGRVLIPAGNELTENSLKALARREITRLTVLREVEEDPVAREAERVQMLARVKHVFRKAGESVETRQLFQAILDFRLEHRS